MFNYAIDHAEKIFNGHAVGQLIHFLPPRKKYGTKKRPEMRWEEFLLAGTKQKTPTNRYRYDVSFRPQQIVMISLPNTDVS